jgi:hypothetical protein
MSNYRDDRNCIFIESAYEAENVFVNNTTIENSEGI